MLGCCILSYSILYRTWLCVALSDIVLCRWNAVIKGSAHRGEDRVRKETDEGGANRPESSEERKKLRENKQQSDCQGGRNSSFLSSKLTPQSLLPHFSPSFSPPSSF